MTEHYPTLRSERDGAIVTLTFDRPDAANAIDVHMSRDLLRAAIACDQDETVRAVLLQSRGNLFSGGGDVSAFAAAGDKVPDLISDGTVSLHAAVARLARMNKPMVTAVQGFAAGAGFSLAMLGDVVIAGRSAQFTLAYTGIGFSPDAGASWLLPRLVGLRKAQHLILDNVRLSADEALAIGLVTHVVEDADLEAAARAQAARFAAGPTKAFARSRALLLSAFSETLETHLEREARSIVDSARGVDGKEGISAFLAKREPSFTGLS